MAGYNEKLKYPNVENISKICPYANQWKYQLFEYLISIFARCWEIFCPLTSPRTWEFYILYCTSSLPPHLQCQGNGSRDFSILFFCQVIVIINHELASKIIPLANFPVFYWLGWICCHLFGKKNPKITT